MRSLAFVSFLISLTLIFTLQSNVVFAQADEKNIAETILEAENLIKNNNANQAEKLLHNKLKLLSDSPADLLIKAEIFSSFAGWSYAEDRYSDAIEYLQKQIEILDKFDNKSLDKAKAINRLGNCFYHKNKVKEALDQYLAALKIVQPLVEPGNFIMNEILDNIIGCMIAEKNYKEAESYCLQLIRSYHAMPDQADLSDEIAESWAYLTLSDIYRKLDDTKKAEEAFSKWTKSIVLITRSKLSAPKNFDVDNDQIEKREIKNIAAKQASSNDFWEITEAHEADLPIVVWRDRRVEAKTIVVCVHGLGLNSHSYNELAKALVKRGFTVIAMDVRGFGAWSRLKGQDTVDFNSSIADFQYLIKTIHENSPESKVFLLGESMGGALALQTVADYPGIVSGLISSVPASERYKRRKTNMQVALHFLQGPNKPFDIGTGIINQATKKPSLKDKWRKDPRDRLELTPVELIKFDVFMNANLKHAEKIKNTPVLVVQGSKDKLVKPESTIKLFNALACDDRNLLIIGKAEHLIFEEGQFNNLLVDGLANWMNFHAQN
jgi:alpha-beta hydrolase superfamily lysophospholipase